MKTYHPIQVGDVVRWHDMNVDWVVLEIKRNGTLTIETEIPGGGKTRTERRVAQQRDCRVVGQQLAMDLEPARSAPGGAR